jgi:hypothetical protein
MVSSYCVQIITSWLVFQLQILHEEVTQWMLSSKRQRPEGSGNFALEVEFRPDQQEIDDKYAASRMLQSILGLRHSTLVEGFIQA